MLLVDVSGSMGDPADPDGAATPTKLDLAKTAVVEALDEFAADDDVGLRIFTTGIGPNQDRGLDGPRPDRAARRSAGERSRATSTTCSPSTGTPLYTATQDTYDDMLEGFDPTRINAVVLLSDGRNEDPEQQRPRRRSSDISAPDRKARTPSRCASSPSPTAGTPTSRSLRRIAEATNAQVYDASDATTISQVFTAVVSNF